MADKIKQGNYLYVLAFCLFSCLPILAILKNTGFGAVLFSGQRHRIDELREILLFQNQNISTLIEKAEEGEEFKRKFVILRSKGLQITKELLELQTKVDTLEKEVLEANKELGVERMKRLEEVKRLNTTYIKYFSTVKQKLKKLSEEKIMQSKANERLESRLEEETQKVHRLEQASGFSTQHSGEKALDSDCEKKVHLLQQKIDELASKQAVNDENTKEKAQSGQSVLEEGEDASQLDISVIDDQANGAEHGSRQPERLDRSSGSSSRYSDSFRTDRGETRNVGYSRYGNDRDDYRLSNDRGRRYDNLDRDRVAYGSNRNYQDSPDYRNEGRSNGYMYQDPRGYPSGGNDLIANDFGDNVRYSGSGPLQERVDYVESSRKCSKPAFNQDRDGGSFYQTGVTSARNCQRLCKKNTDCKVWVYVKVNARCYLKDSVTAAISSNCCISGIC
mmetsp:Transcript_11730/g.13494  ORF Transcript_11730/g.13494 Transcript_11730/m.13494 type:complete len:448 (+) Transcript_11730:61-1404(+)